MSLSYRCQSTCSDTAEVGCWHTALRVLAPGIRSACRHIGTNHCGSSSTASALKSGSDRFVKCLREMSAAMGDATPCPIGSRSYRRRDRLGGDDERAHRVGGNILAESALHAGDKRPVLIAILKYISIATWAKLKPKHLGGPAPVSPSYVLQVPLGAESFTTGSCRFKCHGNHIR